MTLWKPRKLSKKEIPEDLGIVIESPEKALWIKVKEARESQIKAYEEALIIEKAIVEMAENKLKQLK